jgi:KaiC/GvpD/RAD55 family RecA-like ATPase
MELSKVSSKQIVEACGSFQVAVDTTMLLERALWEVALRKYRPGQRRTKFRKAQKEDLLALLSSISPAQVDLFLSRLIRKDLFRDYGNGRISFDLNLFRPFVLARTILETIKPDHEIRYHVLRNIRKTYGCNQTADIARIFYLLGDAVNKLHISSTAPLPQREKLIWNYDQEFLPLLQEALTNDGWDSGAAQQKADLFVECCRMVGYLRAHYLLGHVELRTTSVDAAFLLSNLFGIPTGIKGFDDLFGGGGIIFHDNVDNGTNNGAEESESGAAEESESDDNFIGGRTVLILGRFGTGKSLLSLQLAVEVARKGGLAWVVPLEQSAQECLYTLESIRALPDDGSVEVATDIVNAVELLQKKTDERGALIFLKSGKDSYDDFLKTFSENAKLMKQYHLRLVCVDPINSIYRKESSITKLRDMSLKMVEQIEQTGTNLVLVAEENTDLVAERHTDPDRGLERNLIFEQNIADTVIRLSVQKEHGYAARFFEIMKSRLQREQRGAHPFSIVPGSGINIFPSSSAVSARIRPRGVRALKGTIQFGLPALDSILGEGAISVGDVIVLQGTGGSFKTPLGLIFLLGSDWKEGQRPDHKNRSLLIAARDDEATVRHLLEQEFVRQFDNAPKTKRDIEICALPHGHIYPGYVIQRIEDEFIRARLNNYRIDRVMVDDVAHWEMSSPLIREDEIFGDTLIELLRRQGVTSLITCSDYTIDQSSAVQRSIIDGANCVVKFERFEYGGLNRVMVKVQKTRGMRHRGESFEFSLGKTAFEVKPSSSLLREVRGGKVSPIKIRLFLRSTSSIQQKYNNRILEVIRAVLSRDSKIESQDRLYMSKAMGLSSSSVLDELHVIQLDEFQLPNVSDVDQRELLLHTFSPTQWSPDWDDFLPQLIKRVRYRNEGFFAIPYFENISLLAYRSDQISENDLNSWTRLSEQSAEWEKNHPNSSSVFFDYPQTPENLNCLFLEILLSLEALPERSGVCKLLKLLDSPTAIKAAEILYRIGRKSYIARGSIRTSSDLTRKEINPEDVNPKAVVWRLWYTTLNQVLSQLTQKESQKINITGLPKKISIAGEWYLGVPIYSAAPDVGLEIIKLLTSHEAEIDRLQSGVGLPSRSRFYDLNKTGTPKHIPLFPYFNLDINLLKELVEGSLRRSQCGSYTYFSGNLSYHLKKILEISDGSDAEINSQIHAIFASLKATLQFMGKDWNCSHCRM